MSAATDPVDPTTATGATLPRTPRSRARIARRLQQAQGRLSTAALQRMDRDMGWFRELGAQERSWIGTIVQAGIRSFVDWYRDPEGAAPSLRADIFGQAPRAFAGQISLQRTVAMVRTSIEVVEENVVEVLGEADAPEVLDAITRYGREVAFATAEIYARAAELRGAWDARLEALVVDSVLRGETDGEVESRASALGWRADGPVVTVVGPVPTTPVAGDPVEVVRRMAHDAGARALGAVQGERMVAIVGAPRDGRPVPMATLAEGFGAGPVVVGPWVEELADVPASAAAALSGFRAAGGWPGAPRPVEAADLLPERVLHGDRAARAELAATVLVPLAGADVVRDTVRTYLEHGGSLERTARALFVHSNTVRYRLRRATELTHRDPADPRDAYTLRIALTLADIGEEL